MVAKLYDDKITEVSRFSPQNNLKAENSKLYRKTPKEKEISSEKGQQVTNEKKWIKINDNTNSQIKFKTMMLESKVCDDYILSKRNYICCKHSNRRCSSK